MQQIKFETKKIMCNKLFLISTAILIGYYIFMIIGDTDVCKFAQG